MGSVVTLLARDPVARFAGRMEARKGYSGGVPQALRRAWAQVVSTAGKYRNKYGSGGTRIDARGRWPAGMDAGGRAACCCKQWVRG
jgi:hypothetical protein